MAENWICFFKLQENRAAIETKKYQILSTRIKKEKERKKRTNKPKTLNPEGRAPPFKRLACFSAVLGARIRLVLVGLPVFDCTCKYSQFSTRDRVY